MALRPLTVLVDEHADGDAAEVEAVQEVLDVLVGDGVIAIGVLVLQHALSHCGHHVIVAVPDGDQGVSEPASGEMLALGHPQSAPALPFSSQRLHPLDSSQPTPPEGRPTACLTTWELHRVGPGLPSPDTPGLRAVSLLTLDIPKDRDISVILRAFLSLGLQVTPALPPLARASLTGSGSDGPQGPCPGTP